jgi:hypothetical protein
MRRVATYVDSAPLFTFWTKSKKLIVLNVMCHRQYYLEWQSLFMFVRYIYQHFVMIQIPGNWNVPHKFNANSNISDLKKIQGYSK